MSDEQSLVAACYGTNYRNVYETRLLVSLLLLARNILARKNVDWERSPGCVTVHMCVLVCCVFFSAAGSS